MWLQTRVQVIVRLPLRFCARARMELDVYNDLEDVRTTRWHVLCTPYEIGTAPSHQQADLPDCTTAAVQYCERFLLVSAAINGSVSTSITWSA